MYFGMELDLEPPKLYNIIDTSVWKSPYCALCLNLASDMAAEFTMFLALQERLPTSIGSFDEIIGRVRGPLPYYINVDGKEKYSQF
jgi:hypothetical protein